MKIKLLIMFVVLIKFSYSLASFEQKSIRFLSPLDVILKLKNTFPARIEVHDVYQCKSISDNNINILGGSAASTGKAIQNNPQHLFINWYFNCVKLMSENYFLEAKKNKDLTYFDRYIPAIILKNYTSFQKLEATEWGELPIEDQKKIIIFQLTQVIGPEAVLGGVESRENYLTKSQKILESIELKDKKELIDVIKWISIATMMQTEALRY